MYMFHIKLIYCLVRFYFRVMCLVTATLSECISNTVTKMGNLLLFYTARPELILVLPSERALSRQ